MKTWTVRLSDPLSQNYAVVTAESVAMGIAWLERELETLGHIQAVRPEQFIPMPTSTRKVRLLLGEFNDSTTH